MSETRLGVFLGITPGLEQVLCAELDGLGFADAVKATVQGGVELQIDTVGLWRLAWQCRTAESLRVRLGRFRATNFDALTRQLVKLPWAAWFARDAAPEVTVTSRRSRLYHSDAVAERAASAIAERLSTSAERLGTAGVPASVVHLRLVRDEVTVSLDAAGERLHRRGYRTHVGKAPLRETLAAAMLHLAALGPGHDRVLWDPFCGSGTLLVEAAAMRLGRAAPVGRGFAFEQWPVHDPEAYRAFTAMQAPERTPPDDTPLVIGSDIDPDEVDAARHNLAAADLDPVARLLCGDSVADGLDEHVPEGAAVVTNLPYGKRTESGRRLRVTFERFGALLRRRTDLGPVVVMNGHRDFARATGVRWRSAATLRNRGTPVEILALDR